MTVVLPKIQPLRNFLYLINNIERRQLSVSETHGALQWGRNHEQKAFEDFSKENQIEVSESGIFLFKNSFLGASPDGLTNSVRQLT